MRNRLLLHRRGCIPGSGLPSATPVDVRTPYSTSAPFAGPPQLRAVVRAHRHAERRDLGGEPELEDPQRRLGRVVRVAPGEGLPRGHGPDRD